MDPWQVLAVVAAGTSRIQLGTMITPVARRRPWKLAKEVTTLDLLSGGRAILGVGLGAPAGEFSLFGEPADARHRAELLDEGLADRGRAVHRANPSPTGASTTPSGRSGSPPSPSGARGGYPSG